MESSEVFDPRSPLAQPTVDLFNVTLIISAVIFALVAGLVIYCIWRFRARAGAAEPRQLFGHKRLEIVWTVIPCLILVYLFVLTVRAMNSSDPVAKSGVPDLVIVGHQFWWEVRYPKLGIVTANEIHFPVGQRWLVKLQTADVIHSFWIPQLGRKMDTMPDRANYIWLQADRPGQYQGACSEFCGLQHAWMRILAVAQDSAEFEAWVRERQGTNRPTDELAIEGHRVFQELTCANCHAVPGTSFPAQAGPDLTHLASRQTLGAGVLKNTPENLAKWIRNPQAFKPGNLMPPMPLPSNQEKALLAYLQSLR